MMTKFIEESFAGACAHVSAIPWLSENQEIRQIIVNYTQIFVLRVPLMHLAEREGRSGIVLDLMGHSAHVS